MFGHVVMQDLMNEENGGLTDEGVENFISGMMNSKTAQYFLPSLKMPRAC